MSSELVEGQVCKANISPTGRRFRIRVGFVTAAVAAILLGSALVLHWPWYLRLIVFFPVAGSAFGFLQARANTCVARAREGTFERDDMSTTKAADDEVAASRKVAAVIQRRVVLIASATALFSAATAFIS